MTIYAKKITPAQKEWLEHYESLTGFEPIHQEELDSGDMTFNDVRQSNISWYELHTSDVYLRISKQLPGLTNSDMGQ